MPDKITCTKCNDPKDENEFPLNGDGKGGRRKQCRECMKNINKKWRADHKQAVSDYNKKRRKKQPQVAVAAAT